MNSIIWENAGNRVLRVEGFGSNATLNLTGAVTFRNNTGIYDDSTAPGGGAIAIQGQGLASVSLDDNAVFTGNYASSASGEVRGGAVLAFSNDARITLGNGRRFPCQPCFWRQTKQAAGAAQCLPRAVPPPLK